MSALLIVVAASALAAEPPTIRIYEAATIDL